MGDHRERSDHPMERRAPAEPVGELQLPDPAEHRHQRDRDHLRSAQHPGQRDHLPTGSGPARTEQPLALQSEQPARGKRRGNLGEQPGRILLQPQGALHERLAREILDQRADLHLVGLHTTHGIREPFTGELLSRRECGFDRIRCHELCVVARIGFERDHRCQRYRQPSRIDRLHRERHQPRLRVRWHAAGGSGHQRNAYGSQCDPVRYLRYAQVARSTSRVPLRTCPPPC